MAHCFLDLFMEFSHNFYLSDYSHFPGLLDREPRTSFLPFAPHALPLWQPQGTWFGVHEL
jgi:hypothetical protein